MTVRSSAADRLKNFDGRTLVASEATDLDTLIQEANLFSDRISTASKKRFGRPGRTRFQKRALKLKTGS